MRHLIILILLSLSLCSYAQDCIYAVNKNGILQTENVVLAYNKDLSGVMATAKRDGEFKYFELFMFLSKKYSFKKGNEIQIELKDGRIVTGIFSENGKAIYSDAVGYFGLKIKVNFPQDSYSTLSMVPIVKIKMQSSKSTIEMMSVGDPNKFMEIVRCIL